MSGPAERPGDGRSRVALLTYSTRPRGGVVHTLYLAEALHHLGEPVHVFALGDPDSGFYRPMSAPHTILPAPRPEGTLEERVFRTIEAFTEALRSLPTEAYEIFHAQDCIAARAATTIRNSRGRPTLIRTVHHIDDFTTPALVDCQRRSIVEPDRLLVVSDFWRRSLRQRYGVESIVVTNGVDADRFRRPEGFDPSPVRRRIGAAHRSLFLTVGGIEPRKGSLELIEALARLKAGRSPDTVLAVVGDHAFQDYASYRSEVLDRAAALGLEIGGDVVLLGMVPEGELPSWYWSADAFVFPSVNEGFGLAVLEAMAAGLPVVATDIPVFREYARGGQAILVPPGNAGALAEAMTTVIHEPARREELSAMGRAVAARFTWEQTARQHQAIYRSVLRQAIPLQEAR